MEMDFDNVVKVLKALKAVYDNRDNETNLISALIGNGPDTADLLQALEQDVVQGLQNVVTAIQEQTLTQEWSGIANSLGYAHGVIKQYQTELASVSNQSGTCMITSNGQNIPFSDWCLGTSTSTGALSMLNLLVGSAPINIMDPSVSSLSGIFSTSVPAGSSSTLGLNALPTWIQILSNAQSNTSQSLLGNTYKYETQYESVLRLMSYTHTLVALVYYIHDSALQLLITSTGSASNCVSIGSTIAANFGDYATAGSIWNQFTQEFENLSSGTPDQQQFNSTYFSLPLPPSVTYNHITIDIPVWSGGDSPNGGGETYPYSWAFCSYPVSLANNPDYPNSFFGSLGYLHVNQGSGSEVKVLGLQGTVVQVGAGLAFSTQGLYPSSDFYSDSSNWGNMQFSGIGTYQESFLPVPATASTNLVPVITGFQLQVITNGAGAFNIGLALQFGVLDVTDPNNPVVTVSDESFVAPAYAEAKAFQDYTSMIQSGRFDAVTGNLLPAILSNATLCRVQGGDNAVVVQVASPIYMADFLQPDKLPQIIPASTTPAPSAVPAG
ncbi:MAG: hypothetical protein FD123_2743 [Bacteroidetes bacterium]|nr:MAG: hypothetical protein FD123_2743 [Bacteroidota bacterium]